MRILYQSIIVNTIDNYAYFIYNCAGDVMSEYLHEEFKSQHSYRVKYVLGMNAANTVRQDYHRTINLVFMFWIKGKGSINIEGTSHELCTGDVIMMNPSEFFLTNVENGCYHERITLLVNLNMVNLFPCDCLPIFSKFYKREKKTGNIIPSAVVKKYGVDKLFLELLGIVREDTETKEPLAICKIIELLNRMGKTFDETLCKSDGDTLSESFIDKVLRYIEENYEKDIKIQDIAEHFSVHRSYLSHEFNKKVGTSVWNYIILRRIHKFNSLMTPDSSIEEGAYSVGFRNYSNFFRLYKKHMGMTPMEYKRQFKKSE